MVGCKFGSGCLVGSFSWLLFLFFWLVVDWLVFGWLVTFFLVACLVGVVDWLINCLFVWLIGMGLVVDY